MKKFDKYLFTGWGAAVVILLAKIFNYMFNLFIDNIVREPIIDESLFCFLLLHKILFWRRRLVLHGILGY